MFLITKSSTQKEKDILTSVSKDPHYYTLIKDQNFYVFKKK